MNKMRHYRRFLLLLAMMSAVTYGMAQDWADVPEKTTNATARLYQFRLVASGRDDAWLCAIRV